MNKHLINEGTMATFCMFDFLTQALCFGQSENET